MRTAVTLIKLNFRIYRTKKKVKSQRFCAREFTCHECEMKKHTVMKCRIAFSRCAAKTCRSEGVRNSPILKLQYTSREDTEKVMKRRRTQLKAINEIK